MVQMVPTFGLVLEQMIDLFCKILIPVKFYQIFSNSM